MGIPAIQKTHIGAYILRKMFAGSRRFPLVLMLEPLFQCNLRCKGCGKIAYPDDILNHRLSVEDCISAVESCRAPVVSIPGGEPLLHPDIHVIVRELVARKRFVYLCTNGLLVDKRINEFDPSPYLTFNIHIDGMKNRHDKLVGRNGAFEKTVSAIQQLVSCGFRVTTNTTLFNGDPPDQIARFFDFVTSLEIDGMTVSPGFSYENASDTENFLSRKSAKTLFRRLLEIGRDSAWEFNHSRLYLDFLSGNQDYICTPWGNPTRNIFGWQRPCYLLSDGYADTYEELMETTAWERYGYGKDPRCANCMVHSGFEPTAVMDTVKNPLKALMVSLRGR
jgi:hopanoid biosynthesis associated radical SAM protein HpnH